MRPDMLLYAGNSRCLQSESYCTGPSTSCSTAAAAAAVAAAPPAALVCCIVSCLGPPLPAPGALRKPRQSNTQRTAVRTYAYRLQSDSVTNKKCVCLSTPLCSHLHLQLLFYCISNPRAKKFKTYAPHHLRLGLLAAGSSLRCCTVESSSQ